jgi:hypothetical protein
MLDEDVPKYWDQTFLVAKNPIVAAKFFNLVMKAFIKTLLGFDPKHESLNGGILGIVKGYYGCVEAQGRGTLHCHMLIWVEGGLNPNQIRDRVMKQDEESFRRRLLAFLDDTISTCVPPDPDRDILPPSSKFHPCTVRNWDNATADVKLLEEKDLHNVVMACQRHKHQSTCYKYSPDKTECRFGLSTTNYVPISTIDPETGELHLRCLDGLVNNFNSTIIQTIRCNMDLKFIGSGPEQKI